MKVNYRTCLKILLLMSLTVFATAAKLMAENSAKNGSFRTITVAISKPADFTTIKEAVNDANDGDCVVVADGTYGDYWNSEVDFKGKAITLRSEHGPKHCIINCQNRQRAFVFQSGEDSNSVVS